MKYLILFSFLALAACGAPAQLRLQSTLPPDGKGTRVTNAQPVDWAFWRGTQALASNTSTQQGDVVKATCLTGSCGTQHGWVTIWATAGTQVKRTIVVNGTPSSGFLEQVTLQGDEDQILVAWLKTPFTGVPIDHTTLPGQSGPAEGVLIDDDDAEVGILQWGAVDVVP